MRQAGGVGMGHKILKHVYRGQPEYWDPGNIPQQAESESKEFILSRAHKLTLVHLNQLSSCNKALILLAMDKMRG